MKSESPSRFKIDRDTSSAKSKVNPAYGGLCCNCRNAGDCTFRKGRKTPAPYCEEFSIDILPAEKPTEKEAPLPTCSADGDARIPWNLLGLCGNCDNRETCLYPKPEGGIWHCEEYR
jgi:hypothetical protein